MRILVIGLDGATWTVLKPLMEKGYMPYLSKLRKEGASGILRSTIPPITTVAWASFQTGVMPGKHGVYGFQTISRTPQGHLEFRVVNASCIRTKTLWQYLSGLGKRLGLVNLPMTYPPAAVAGFLISGFPTPSQRAPFTYPPALKQVLLAAVPGYRVPTPNFGRVVKENRVVSYVHQMIQMAGSRAQAVLFLMGKYPWDVIVLHFQETDFLQHPLWHHLDYTHPYFSQEKHQIIAQFFQKIDELIRAVAQELSDNDLLMIVSDHGFQSMRRIFYPNCWLYQEGYLEPSRKTRAMAYRTAFATLRSLDIFNLRKRFIADGTRKHLTQELMRREFDWERSVVYAEAGHTGEFNLYLTKQDSKIQATLIEKLYEIREPETGGKVVERVLTAAEAFGTDLSSGAPDLVVCLREGYIAVSHVEQGPLFEKREPGQDYQIGVHHPDGIIIAKGPRIRQGWDRLQANIIDIAPTLLYQMSLPIPSYLDGRILYEMYDPEFLKGKKAQFIEDKGAAKDMLSKGLTQSEEEQIQKYLQDLGYL